MYLAVFCLFLRFLIEVGDWSDCVLFFVFLFITFFQLQIIPNNNSYLCYLCVLPHSGMKHVLFIRVTRLCLIRDRNWFPFASTWDHPRLVFFGGVCVAYFVSFL